MKHDLWQKAAAFAACAHRHQVRKDGETPYVSHVFRVALTIRHAFGFDDEAILAAALLHDTIEDTSTDYDEVEEAFGAEVAKLVALMTKDMRLPEDLREEAYDRQLAEGPWQARLIKLADVYDNLCDAIDGKRSVDKMLEKAQRAVDLAAEDEHVAEARKMVEGLIAIAKS